MNKYQHQIEIYRTEYPLKSTVLVNPTTPMMLDEFGNEDELSKSRNKITVSNFYTSLKYFYEKEQTEITNKINQKDAEIRESLIKEQMEKETPKFITPVSMQVTEEQYNQDLKKPLEEMGYKEVTVSHIKNNRDCLCTNVNEINNYAEFLNHAYKHRLKRYAIEEYNPELFLALAAMTEGIEPIVGEYIIGTKDSKRCASKKGVIYKVLQLDTTTSEVYRIGPNKLDVTSTVYSRKATKEEIINHFKELSQESVLEDTMKERKELKAMTDQELTDYCNKCEETSFQKEAEKHHSESMKDIKQVKLYGVIGGGIFPEMKKFNMHPDKVQNPPFCFGEKPNETTLNSPQQSFRKVERAFPKQEDKPLEITHEIAGKKGKWNKRSGLDLRSFDKILHLGYCSIEKSDLFAGYAMNTITILKGNINSGKY